MYATQSVDTEITGWLDVRRDKEYFHISGDLVVPEQEVSGASVDVSATNMAVMLDKHENVRLWWHSHVRMGTSASVTDIKQMEGYSENTPYYLMLITNQSNEYTLELWDMENNLIWEQLEFDMVPKRNHDKFSALIEKNVKKKVFTSPYLGVKKGHKTYLPHYDTAYNRTMDYSEFERENYPIQYDTGHMMGNTSINEQTENWDMVSELMSRGLTENDAWDEVDIMREEIAETSSTK
jgi:proteasome lid subunit RPN8/RPN11